MLNIFNTISRQLNLNIVRFTSKIQITVIIMLISLNHFYLVMTIKSDGSLLEDESSSESRSDESLLDVELSL